MRGQGSSRTGRYTRSQPRCSRCLLFSLPSHRGAPRPRYALSATGEAANFCARFLPDPACAEDQEKAACSGPVASLGVILRNVDIGFFSRSMGGVDTRKGFRHRCYFGVDRRLCMAIPYAADKEWRGNSEESQADRPWGERRVCSISCGQNGTAAREKNISESQLCQAEHQKDDSNADRSQQSCTT